jgi:hypothetical protein
VQKELGKSHKNDRLLQPNPEALFDDTEQMEEMKEEKRKSAKPWF